MPASESKFTLGGRLRTSALFVPGGGVVPLIGGAVLAGSTFGPLEEGRFGFFLAGAGVEVVPIGPTAIFTGHLLGGAVLGGLVLAGGIEVGVVQDSMYFLLGVEIGWGRLF